MLYFFEVAPFGTRSRAKQLVSRGVDKLAKKVIRCAQRITQRQRADNKKPAEAGLFFISTDISGGIQRNEASCVT